MKTETLLEDIEKELKASSEDTIDLIHEKINCYQTLSNAKRNDNLIDGDKKETARRNIETAMKILCMSDSNDNIKKIALGVVEVNLNKLI